jgi:hypothetical protein
VVPLKKSGVTTIPLDRVTVILIQCQIIRVFELNFFPQAIPQAGFDSQLTLNYLGLLFRGKGLLAAKVRPIQSNLRFFLHNSFHGMAVNKRATFGVIFLGSISPSKMGRIAPFLATIHPFSKARVFLLSSKFSRMVCMCSSDGLIYRYLLLIY